MKNICVFSIIVMAAMLSMCKTDDGRPPNVLLILADDMGYSDLGCYGGEIQTPNLDNLAYSGIRFSNFSNCARCWPTRAAFMTGYYPQQVGRDNAPGIRGGGGGIRPDWALLLPEYLKEAGYRSYHSGKWHIDGMPVQNGFDKSYYLADQGRFFNPLKHFLDDDTLPPVAEASGYYATVEIADRAVEQLKDHQENFGNKPFFSYIAFTAPHFPLHALPEDVEGIGNRYERGWDYLREKRWERIQELEIVEGELSEVDKKQGPPYYFPDAYEILGEGEVDLPLEWDNLSEIQKRFQEDKMRLHAAMIERMDKEIGRVIEQIDEMEVLDNTIIMFLSDNGASAEIMVRDDGHDPDAVPGSAETYLCLGPGWSTMCNTPFRKHKTWVHEGGSCTPFIVYWPSEIFDTGIIRHSHGHIVDVVPTILDLAGLSDNIVKEIPFPGQSLRPLFSGEMEREKPTWYYHEGNRAIRIGNWKLVAEKNMPWELYNLKADRTETNDLSNEYQSKVSEMEKEWFRILAEMREVTPQKGEKDEKVKVTTKNIE